MPIRIAPNLATDVAGHTTQAKVNCFAWQTFIALNWRASATQRGAPDLRMTDQLFGDPADLALTVWQSYKSAPEVLLPDAQPPTTWNSFDSIPAICAEAGDDDVRWPLFRVDAQSAARIPTIVQATHDILVDQSGNPVYYETRINQDEFNYIVQNKLYDALQQQTVARTQGISLPAGKTSYGNEGAIEIKAAWRILDGQPPEIGKRYKQTRGYLYNSDNNTCVARLMGLVGLHIIRKTPSMPDLMWSTFEQIDNVPANSSDSKAVRRFTFFNADCAANQADAPRSCNANATPLPTVSPPAVRAVQPVQVTRLEPIPADIQALNSYVQQLVQSQSPDSVWQFYQLINVRWPAVAGNAAPPLGATTPLDVSHEQFLSSDLQAVSNVTMETYIQQSDCLSCHICAAIALSSSGGKNGCDPMEPKLASDFSFLFAEAATPSTVFSNSCDGDQAQMGYNSVIACSIVTSQP